LDEGDGAVAAAASTVLIQEGSVASQ